MEFKEDLIKNDLEYIWHPCSQMKDYEELKPIIIKEGKGPYLINDRCNTSKSSKLLWM